MIENGSGDGYGSGYGYGYGKHIGVIDGYTAMLLCPWNYVRVGCQCHSVAGWKRFWEKVARDNSVSITQSQVEELLCKASSCAAEPTAGA